MNDFVEGFLVPVIGCGLIYFLWRWFSWFTDMDTVRRRLREARSRSERRKAAMNKFLSKFF